MGTKRTTLARLGATAAVSAILALGTAGSVDAAGETGPHAGGRVECISPGGTFGSGINLKAGPPTVRAFNYTTGVDRQTVTMQPVLWRWNGSAWVEAVFGEVLKGTATETASPTTWFHTRTNASWGSGEQRFALPPGNHYAVAYKLTWYYASPVSGNPATLSGSQYVWASGYSLFSPVAGPLPTTTYCST